MRHWFSCLFVLLLLVPAVLGLTGGASNGDKTPKAPGLAAANLKEPEYYRAWGNFLKHRLADVPQAATAKNWLDYRLFAMTDRDDIHVGRDGWLFSRQSLEDFRKEACERKARATQLYLDISALARLFKAAGKRFVFAVSPGKATLYPEHVGPAPVAAACGRSFLDLLQDEEGRRPIQPFVRLDGPLEQAKKDGIPVYRKTSSELTSQGAGVAARAILENLFDGEVPEETDGDLSRALLGPAPVESADAGSTPSPGFTGAPATALVYGGPGVSRLLPVLASRFERMDVIQSDTLPSLNHGENPADYEAVLVVVAEAQLGGLHLDLDRVGTLLQAETLADHRASLPLNTLRAQHSLSLEPGEGQLRVKSLGAESLFTLPPLPGTDSRTLRLLKLPVTSARADTLTWHIQALNPSQGKGMLRPGLNKLYIPLPPGRPVQVRVNPGMFAGLFQLAEIEVLEFNLDGQGGGARVDQTPEIAALAPPDEADQPHRIEPVAETAGGSPDEQESPAPPALHLNDFEEGCVFQRRGKTADVVVSGTYQGRPVAIEARVLRHGSGEAVTPWIEIDSAPKQGVFMGMLPEVPQGGWYQVVVRFKDKKEVAQQGKARWGVGILVACLGQSNMKEWFHSGEALKAHSLLSLHRQGRWQPDGLTGNGAIAFGNRLIGRLAVPVGLLDYAVNGSGLRKEADWGTGYWADRSAGGIYQQFIQGLSAAGGALEYVLFMQGEADAARATISESQYLDALEGFITQQIRQDVVNGSQRPHLPFLILGMPKRPVGKDLPHQAIRNAHRTAAREIPECYLAATTLDLTNQGRQHLAPEAYTTLGLRAAQTVLYLLGDTPYYQGPSVSALYKNQPDKIDILLMHHGGSDFKPSDRISGWEVLDSRGPVPINAVTRLNARTIRIELAAAAQGALSVRYLYGAMPDASVPVRDNSPMELPLEAFEGVVK